jgi:hypothetical protein
LRTEIRQNPDKRSFEDHVHYLATCPICEQGLIGVRICCQGREPLALCDECEAIWYEPSCQGQPVYPRDDQCPRCGRPLWERPGRWATRRDIERVGWAKHVIGQARTRSTPKER